MIDDSKIELYPSWRQAVEKFKESGKTFGDVLTHACLFEWFGLTMPERTTPHEVAKKAEVDFFARFEAFRLTMLEDMQIDLDNIRGVGWLIVPPDEQSDRALNDGMVEIEKAHRKALRRAIYTNTSLLSAEKRRVHADNIARIAALGSLYRRVRRLPNLDGE